MSRAVFDELSERAEDVVALLAAAGHGVTKDQLARWHRTGLLGRPTTRSLGLHGTETLYPPGTAVVVERICELKAHDRRLVRIGWALWWEHYPVDMQLVRDLLSARAEDILSTFRELVAEDGTLTEKAEEALNDAPDAYLESAPMRRMRRRVGVDNFDSVLDSLLRVAGGHPRDLGDADLGQLQHAMGMDRARTDVLASTGKPWVEGDPREDFDVIARLVNPALLVESAKVATDEELCRHRDEIQAFAQVLSLQGEIIRDTAGPWAFGLGAYAAFFDDILATTDGQAYFTLLWPVLHGAGLQGGMQAMVVQAPATELAHRQHEALKALRAAVPEVAEAVPMKLLGRAMSDPRAQERINARLAELRARDPEPIDAFFAAHPEYRELAQPAVSD